MYGGVKRVINRRRGQSVRLKIQWMIFLNNERERMIKKKYQQLLLHSRFSGITTMDDTQTLWAM
jgi:hypothetical protein